MKLNEATENRSLIVKSMDLEPHALERLKVLGMIDNTPVTVLQKKGTGTMIINLRGTRFALGSELSRNIEVEYA
ncbi:MAG: ferrous iron transport protein A [Erysipelotrichaceae bacterium]|nr:ferrous iron transport protein A [Erysipelotrichaceae bacterium]